MISRRGFLKGLFAGVMVCAIPVDLCLQAQSDQQLYLDTINDILKKYYLPMIQAQLNQQNVFMAFLKHSGPI